MRFNFYQNLVAVSAVHVAMITAGCAATGSSITAPAGDCCAVVELRQYTMEPGRREELIALFDREFVESQEVLGARIVGQFRDLSNPDRFVWLRGFRDMPGRAEALTAFYGGPVWQAHRAAANPTIADAANVLLLKPVSVDSMIYAPTRLRAPVGSREKVASRVLATIYYLQVPGDADFIQFFERNIRPVMMVNGAKVMGVFQTEFAENNFPKLPIRTGENVLVVFSRFSDEGEMREYLAAMAGAMVWREEVRVQMGKYLGNGVENLLLEPTGRSVMR